jgi:hypothetical protein
VFLPYESHLAVYEENMQNRLYIIDGTGPDSYSDYHADMRRGVCSNLNTLHSSARYSRGPTELGLETWQIGDAMLKEVIADRKKEPDLKIVLVGYSRGGATVIYMAHELGKLGISVYAMVLLDAVRRAIQKLDSEMMLDLINLKKSKIDVIPGNVENVLHLIRDEAFSNYFINTKEYKELKKAATSHPAFSYEPHSTKTVSPKLITDLRRLEELHRRMRDACRFNCIKLGVSTGFSFGNTGLEVEGSCRRELPFPEKYLATHGAMGGAPLDVSKYITDPIYASQIEAEEVCSMLKIWTRVNAFLQKIGVTGDTKNVRLNYVPQTFMKDQNQTRIENPDRPTYKLKH